MNITNIKVYDLEESVIASGYPMLSCIDYKKLNEPSEYYKHFQRSLKLASTPSNSGHGNFLTGIIVSFDLTCSQTFLIQFQRYNFADIISSQSKMHRILSMDISKCCNEYVDKRIIDIVNENIDKYNKMRELLSIKGNENKVNNLEELYYNIIYNIPSGFELTMRISTNYMQLKNQYLQRKDHKLNEWKKYCNDFILKLPYMEYYLKTSIFE